MTAGAGGHPVAELVEERGANCRDWFSPRAAVAGASVRVVRVLKSTTTVTVSVVMLVPSLTATWEGVGADGESKVTVAFLAEFVALSEKAGLEPAGWERSDQE